MNILYTFRISIPWVWYRTSADIQNDWIRLRETSSDFLTDTNLSKGDNFVVLRLHELFAHNLKKVLTIQCSLKRKMHLQMSLNNVNSDNDDNEINS